MLALVGNLRSAVVAVVLLGVLAPQVGFAAGPIRSGKGRLGQIRSPLRGGGAGTNRVQGSPGGFINRHFPGNGPVKRVIAGKNGNTAQPQAKSSKSEILEKYGARTNGKWANMGQTVGASAAESSDPSKPSNPSGQMQVVAAPSAKAAAVDAKAADAVVAGDVDLLLEDVQFIGPATETAGPTYRVKFRNQGTGAAGPFRIGAFAEREGKLSDDAPQTVTEVAGLAAGEAGEVTLRLPLASMRLVGASAAQSVAFDQLLVVVDLDDSVVESEKSNNVTSLERTEREAAR